MTGDPELGPIGQIALPVDDVDRATAFYRDTLGLPFLFEAPGMSFFDCGGVRLMLTLPEGEEPGGASILYFRVGDVREAHGALRDRGVAFHGEPHVVHRTDDVELWMAFFADSEGHVMALMSEVSTA